ncbi:hypothetical protein BY996DRAFT_6418536 [Phakopsora pachyrhizi]|uniref:Uncharacterized protein n=1 Tax=Phakopsora pachyrhizi TaxID=170000 RepID=A0AAV0BTI1_PHAPC|nr:hypothetical protein BY996DRAFT_6418536 [Phakopsora pachyrhizi]CAH7690821.1 hypothetical protein PPACK8108_LOCUS26283 [Phakopsora pachyrhizi]
MIFLAGLLNRSSLSFVFVTIVRIISIFAIIFAVAIEIYLIGINLHKFKRNATGSSSDESFNLSNSTINLSPGDVSKISGFENGTNIPKAIGGILFFVLEQVLNILILVICLFSEILTPRISELFDEYLAVLGSNFGVGAIGFIEIYIASTLLSKNLTKLNNKIGLASGWILFLIGLINLILGMIFGKHIRNKRSLIDAGTSYVKKTTHIDDIETGIKFAKKGAAFGKKKNFKNLKPSMISRPTPQEITKPIVGFIDKNRFDYDENLNLQSPQSSSSSKKTQFHNNYSQPQPLSPSSVSAYSTDYPEQPAPIYNTFSRLKPSGGK